MTTEAAAAFVERLLSDEAFRKRVVALEDPADRLALAREEGFDLSADDNPAIARALGVEELADQELEHVVGGVGGHPDVSGAAIFVG